MKHRLGTGTINVSVNLLVEERQAVGRLACARDESISAFVRRATLAALEAAQPQAAAVLRAIRRNRHVHLLERHLGQLTLQLFPT